jgi:hypothetical protein
LLCANDKAFSEILEMKNEDEWLDGSRTARFSFALPGQAKDEEKNNIFRYKRRVIKSFKDLTLRRTWQERRTERKKGKERES